MIKVFLPLSLLAITTICIAAPKPPAENQKLARAILQDLIEAHSTHEVGTEAPAKSLAARFKAAGFAAEDVQLIPEDKYPNQVNLIVRLKGRGEGKPILWLSHLDVVEAKPEDWSLPPFKLTEKEGYFYGRGTADMKDEDAAVAAALIRLKQEGFVPDHDIVAAFTTDEEKMAEQNGVSFLLRKHPDLMNAEFIINPDGGSGEIVNGKRFVFEIETSQKTYAAYALEVTNKGGHSSEPRTDNAIVSLANGLMKLSQYSFPFVVNATTRQYFQRMSAKETGQTRADMLAVARDNPDLAAASRLANNVSLNAILHTTCVPTMLSGGHQENALPQRATAIIQCRLMPGETIKQTQVAIETAIADAAISVKPLDPGYESSPETLPSAQRLAAIEKVTHSMWPDVLVLPTMIAGATDSRYARRAGIPSYGIGGGWNNYSDLRMHGKDERHEINDFYSSVEFTYRLMKELSGLSDS